MAVLYPDFPDHGQGDWDVPLLNLLSDLVNQGNAHELTLAGLGSSGVVNSGSSSSSSQRISLSQNVDGTWNLTLTGY